MNTETKAEHDALGTSRRRTAEHQTGSYDGSKEKLLADLKMVVTDAEQLIKEAADCSVEAFAALRARFEKRLVAANAKLGQAGTAVGERARYATDVTHAYVKDNLWQSAALCGAAGAIIGFLLARR